MPAGSERGLDIIGAHYVRTCAPPPLKPWAKARGFGVYLNHDASRTSNDCSCAKFPQAELAPQRQLFER